MPRHKARKLNPPRKIEIERSPQALRPRNNSAILSQIKAAGIRKDKNISRYFL
jgi:hypothetical protein